MFNLGDKVSITILSGTVYHGVIVGTPSRRRYDGKPRMDGRDLYEVSWNGDHHSLHTPDELKLAAD